MSKSNYSSQQLNNYPSDVNVSSREAPAIDYKQAIHLIKSILGLEYCLQYQIIPLKLKQGCLILGMVNPEDQAALSFVRPIANALSYRIVLETIDSATHQLVLAEYLKQNHTSAQPQKSGKDNNSEQTIAEMTSQTPAQESDSAMTITEIPFEPKEPSKLGDDQPTIYAPIDDSVLEPETNPAKPNHQSNPHSNQQITYAQNDELINKPSIRPNYPVKDVSPGQKSLSSPYKSEQVLEVTAEPIPESKIPYRDKKKSKTNTVWDEVTSVNKARVSEPTPAISPLTREALSVLSPRQLWQELLIKILDAGIGRLYFERNQHCGRILCSQDGVVQSSLNNVSLPILQALINEVKTLARVPLEQLKKPKKVAIEKHYQQERLLLRIEMFPSKWGDEITIQVLRGKALKFYEQRQVKKMTEQALTLAQKLEKTLTKMRVCFDSAEIGDLSELQKIQQEINRQLKLLER